MSADTQFGFAAVIGLPNAGKSTLVNTLVGQKVSIVSSKVQTTRARVLGIVTHDAAQLVLIDTPGIFSAKKTMERAMVGAAVNALDDADMVMHIVDVSHKGALENNRPLIKRLPENKACFLVMNKIDKCDRETLLKIAGDFNEAYNYKATFMISALKGQGTKDLAKQVMSELPKEPWMFDGDDITDMPMRLLAAEITREKIFERLYRELPTSTYVETENWEEFDNGDVKISQQVIVERDSQKAIVLGKQGRQIKQIGQEARVELENMFERRVHLKLFVKVRENWSESPEILRLIGLLET
ncbi:MAG: GTPase Era [Micavibrio sp.]|nr:GTPase Era [Micavibrio sp.]